MTSTEKEIKVRIENAKSILVLSHIRPDWDAVASVLLTVEFIKHSYPDKRIHFGIEKGEIYGAEYLPGYDKLDQDLAINQLETFAPDLLIIVDCPSIARVAFEPDPAYKFIVENKLFCIALDHHELEVAYLPNLVSNHGYNSAVEEIFTLFSKSFKFRPTEDGRKYLASGLLGDTNNFLFLHKHSNQTFEYAKYLVESGINLAEIDRLQNQYSPSHLKILAEFFNNLVIMDGITYSFISDKFYKDNSEISRDRYTETKEVLQLHFLRQVSKNSILFILYPECPGYKGSLRALNNTYDCTVFARYLNGGGHKSASGFKLIEPKSIQDAIDIVIQVLKNHKAEARID